MSPIRETYKPPQTSEIEGLRQLVKDKDAEILSLTARLKALVGEHCCGCENRDDCLGMEEEEE